MEKITVFRVDTSLAFTPQIPDSSLGPLRSRCANCNAEVEYRQQICKECKYPFIGPLGFPNFDEWKKLSPSQKEEIVILVYTFEKNKGRIEYPNVVYIPLTKNELLAVKKLKGVSAMLFYDKHGVSSHNIHEILK